MATFSITVDVSTLATALELYYTHIKPDGTTSSPAQKYTGVGVGGFIVLPPTPHPAGYTYTINNIVLNDNTVYNFEVKQFCIDGTTENSIIDEDHYKTNCMGLSIQVGNFDYQNEEYPIVATWTPGPNGFNPDNYSIQDYILNITNDSGTTDYILVPAVPATVPGSTYSYSIGSDDLIDPLVYGEIYDVSLSFNIVLSTGNTITVDCDPKSIELPYLRTYKIHGSEGWIVDWIDENNVHQRACNLGPPLNTPVVPPGAPCEFPWLLVHHRVNPGAITSSNPYYPVCGYCVTPGVIFPAPYNFMYLPNPTVYDSDKVNCYPINASTPNPSVPPCGNCGDTGTGNNYRPAWGATHHLIGDGYVTIPGVISPLPCILNNVCTGAPSW